MLQYAAPPVGAGKDPCLKSWRVTACHWRNQAKLDRPRSWLQVKAASHIFSSITNSPKQPTWTIISVTKQRLRTLSVTAGVMFAQSWFSTARHCIINEFMLSRPGWKRHLHMYLSWGTLKGSHSPFSPYSSHSTTKTDPNLGRLFICSSRQGQPKAIQCTLEDMGITGKKDWLLIWAP